MDKPSKIRKKKKSGAAEEKGKLKLEKGSKSTNVAASNDNGSKVEKLSLIVLEEVCSELYFFL